jgi:hypothetical protein
MRFEGPWWFRISAKTRWSLPPRLHLVGVTAKRAATGFNEMQVLVNMGCKRFVSIVAARDGNRYSRCAYATRNSTN